MTLYQYLNGLKVLKDLDKAFKKPISEFDFYVKEVCIKGVNRSILWVDREGPWTRVSLRWADSDKCDVEQKNDEVVCYTRPFVDGSGYFVTDLGESAHAYALRTGKFDFPGHNPTVHGTIFRVRDNFSDVLGLSRDIRDVFLEILRTRRES